MSRPADASSVLVELILKKMQIDPEISINKVIKFRRERRDELGRFRTEVGTLIKDLHNPDYETMKREVEDVYLNQIEPAVNDLQAALDDSGIKWLSDGMLKIATLSVPPTALISWLATPVVGLAIGAGLTLLAAAANRYVDRRETLRKSRYSYLLHLKHLQV
jgi:hypothetical protein